LLFVKEEKIRYNDKGSDKVKLGKELLPYISILLIVILVRTFIVTPIKVNGSSMYKTLNGNEIMLLWKNKKWERFDIIVAKTPTDTLIKRLYAFPNESIECKNGDIYINDTKIEDPYGFGETEDFEKIILKEDEYFIMGDNRLISLDSRRIGAITKDQIEGVTDFILFPFSKFGKTKN